MTTVHITDPIEDINIVLPSGETIVLQYRDDGGTYPSLDICFEKERLVYNWARGMEPAPQNEDSPADRRCFQLWIGLDPTTPHY